MKTTKSDINYDEMSQNYWQRVTFLSDNEEKISELYLGMTDFYADLNTKNELNQTDISLINNTFDGIVEEYKKRGENIFLHRKIYDGTCATDNVGVENLTAFLKNIDR